MTYDPIHRGAEPQSLQQARRCGARRELGGLVGPRRCTADRGAECMDVHPALADLRASAMGITGTVSTRRRRR